jgi:hypothetical protein
LVEVVNDLKIVGDDLLYLLTRALQLFWMRIVMRLPKRHVRIPSKSEKILDSRICVITERNHQLLVEIVNAVSDVETDFEESDVTIFSGVESQPLLKSRPFQ